MTKYYTLIDQSLEPVLINLSSPGIPVEKNRLLDLMRQRYREYIAIWEQRSLSLEPAVNPEGVSAHSGDPVGLLRRICSNIHHTRELLDETLETDHEGFLQPTYGTSGVYFRITSHRPNVLTWGKDLRSCVSCPGYAIIKAEYPQLELRVLQALSKDENFLENLNSPQGIYRAFAQNLYGENYSCGKFHISKMALLTFSVGDDDHKLKHSLDGNRIKLLLSDLGEDSPDITECRLIYDTWKKCYPELDRYLATQRDSSSRALVSYYGRTPAEKCTYRKPYFSTATTIVDIIKQALTELYNDERLHYLGVELVTVFHDSIVLRVPDGFDREDIQNLIREDMLGVEPGLTLLLDIQFGSSWEECQQPRKPLQSGEASGV